MPEIQSLSSKHELLMDFILANPEVKLGEVARHFNLSQAWVSTIIHSNAFQAVLSEKQREIFTTCVLSLKDKLSGLAHLSIDKLTDMVESTTDPSLVAKVNKDTLQALGYGSRQNVIPLSGENLTLNLNGQVSLQVYQEAREKLKSTYLNGELAAPPPASTQLENNPQPIPEEATYAETSSSQTSTERDECNPERATAFSS